MAAGLKVTRLDHTAFELRSRAAKSRGAAQVRRLLALAMIHPLASLSAHRVVEPPPSSPRPGEDGGMVAVALAGGGQQAPT